MSGMVNGVDKFYLVYHKWNAMHFNGFKSEEDMAEQLLYQARCLTGESIEQRVAAVEELAQRVIEAIKRDAEMPEHDDTEDEHAEYEA